MACFHRLDFLVELVDKLVFVGPVDQHLHTPLEKFVGNLLAFERHHPVLTRHSGKFDHALYQLVHFLDGRQKRLGHCAEAAKIGAKRCGIHCGEKGSAEHNKD